MTCSRRETDETEASDPLRLLNRKEGMNLSISIVGMYGISENKVKIESNCLRLRADEAGHFKLQIIRSNATTVPTNPPSGGRQLILLVPRNILTLCFDLVSSTNN